MSKLGFRSLRVDEKETNRSLYDGAVTEGGQYATQSLSVVFVAHFWQPTQSEVTRQDSHQWPIFL